MRVSCNLRFGRTIKLITFLGSSFYLVVFALMWIEAVSKGSVVLTFSVRTVIDIAVASVMIVLLIWWLKNSISEVTRPEAP